MTALSLDAIRQEIDRIDDAILALLGERVAATLKVREQKSGDGTITASPIRPAREAAILRRLIQRRGAEIQPETLVRLWRGILVSSTLAQAPVHLHLATPGLHERLLLRDHFGPMTVEEHGSAAEALAALKARPGDIAALPAAGGWAAAWTGETGQASVISTLPVLARGAGPEFLIFGHAQAQASGDDVTIVIGSPLRAAGVLWQAISGAQHVFAVAGFVADSGLSEIASAGSRIAGRCPAPIEV